MPRPKKTFSNGQKRQILEKAIDAADIRDVLEKGIHRKHIADIAHEASLGGLITAEEYSSIAAKISKPLTFPSDPEQRLDAILAGPLNTEPKQIVTLLLRNYPLDAAQLRTEFAVATNGVWTPQALQSYIRDYLLLSLYPIGFVSFPLISQDPADAVLGHTITEAGRRYGQPLSAFALKLVNETGISLNQVLGNTSSSGESRGPYNRFRILESLLTGDARIVDLCDKLNLYSTAVTRHLDALQAMNLVEYDSVNSGERGWAVYEWTNGKPENVQPILHLPTLTTRVAEYLFTHKKDDSHAIVDHLLENNEYKKVIKESLVRRVSNVLAGIAEQGFAKFEYQGRIEMSHVAITQDQERKEFVTEFTRKIRDAAQYGSELRAMEELARAYSKDPALFQQHATYAVQLYIQVSPNINQKSSETWKGEIFEHVSSVGEARTREIQSAVGKGAGQYLTGMVDKGLLTRGKRGPAVIYRANLVANER